MAESLTRATNSCPFCNIYFKSVGNHLRHCKYRNGRDYSQYLAPKTLAKRSQKRKKVLCPKCKKLFVRLGTHLKNSATCKSISSTPPLGVSSAVSAMLTPLAAASISVSNQDAITTAAHNSNSANTACGLPPINNQSSIYNTTPRSLPCIVKGRLLLPTSPEGWEEADHYFESVLVPSLLLSSNPQEISQLLVDGIFSYFSSVCGSGL